MLNELVRVRGLSVSSGERELLHDISFDIAEGETHVIVGAKGAGKTVLGSALMGSPVYRITGGSFVFGGKEITGLSAESRAHAGMFLAFQDPLEMPGITLEEFLIKILEEKEGQPVDIMQFRTELDDMMEMLGLHPSLADKDLNADRTEAEKKKAEILQLLMLAPRFAILDDIFEGLEENDIRLICEGIGAYKEKCSGTLLILSKGAVIPDPLRVDASHVLVQGRLESQTGTDATVRPGTGASLLHDRPEKEVM